MTLKPLRVHLAAGMPGCAFEAACQQDVERQDRSMQVMDAIYKRRAVRSFKEKPVGKDTLTRLLLAAVQAPSAMNQQPWAFVVIQDRDLLKDYSDRAKAFLLKSLGPESPIEHYRETLSDPNFNIFYDAATLVVICAKSSNTAAAEDCCLAAENFMLAALDFGLATCPIGFARPWLNERSTKGELKIPSGYGAVFPIIVGYPKAETPAVARRNPEVVEWKRTPERSRIRELSPVN
jgi:nitroreductase